MPRRTNVSNQRAIQTKATDRSAMQYRLMGLSFKEIASRLGYKTESGAYKAVMRELRSTNETEQTIELRQLHLERLETTFKSVFRAASSSGTYEPDSQQISSIISLLQREAALLGLDAPKQIDTKLNMQVEVLSWNEVLKTMLDSVFAKYGEDSDVASTIIDQIDKVGRERFGDEYGD